VQPWRRRWKTQVIEDFLDDVWVFDGGNDAHFFCASRTDGEYIVEPPDIFILINPI